MSFKIKSQGGPKLSSKSVIKGSTPASQSPSGSVVKEEGDHKIAAVGAVAAAARDYQVLSAVGSASTHTLSPSSHNHLSQFPFYR